MIDCKSVTCKGGETAAIQGQEVFGSEGASNANFFSKLSSVEGDVADNTHCGWKHKFGLVLAAKKKKKKETRVRIEEEFNSEWEREREGYIDGQEEHRDES